MSIAMSVIGGGRIGAAIHALGPDRVALIDRVAGWERLAEPAGEPIMVTVRNDDLDAVLARMPVHRRSDLVFIQNGMLRPWLRERGLERATRGLLFIAVTKRGDPIQAGGVSSFFGPHANAVVGLLGELSSRSGSRPEFGVPAEVLDSEPEFKAIELEKLIWNCAFGLCCEAFDASVGELVDRQPVELRELVTELWGVGQRVFDVTLEFEPLVDRLCAYSRSIPDYRAAAKEWPWRTGAFVRAASDQGTSTPVLTRLSRVTGHPSA